MTRYIKVITIIHFSGGCYEINMDIKGGNIKTSNYLYKDIFDATKCQLLCKLNIECKYFVFDLITQTCTLKRSLKARAIKRKSILGPKHCGKRTLC